MPMIHCLRMFVTRFKPHDRYNVHFMPDTADAEDLLRESLPTDLDVPTHEIVGECPLEVVHRSFLLFIRQMEAKEDRPLEESHWLECMREYVDDAMEKAHPNGDPITIAEIRTKSKRERFIQMLRDAEHVLPTKRCEREAILERIAQLAVSLLPTSAPASP